MKLAKFLLNLDNQYNGHYQTEIKGLSLKKALKLCKELEEYTNDGSSFVVEVWTDGCFTIYRKDFFPEGNQTGRDQMILSVGQ